MNTATITIPLPVLTQRVEDILRRCGLSEQDAHTATEVIVYADSRGFTTHGCNALTGIYAPRLRDGRINPRAVPRTLRDHGATAVLDGDRGLGLVTMSRATDLAASKAARYGIGMVAVRDSTHFGSAGYYAHRVSQTGQVVMVMSNCGAQGVVPPPGSATRMLGTNPLALAAPAPGGADFVLDMSATTVATGKIRAAQRAGRPVPSGWLVGHDGAGSTNPDDFFEGRAEVTWLGGGLETGGAKGFGLATFVDLLCGPLAGAAFGPTPVQLESDEELPDTDIGHVVIVIDPAAFATFSGEDPGSSGTGDSEHFGAQSRLLLDSLTSAPTLPGQPRVSYPGLPEHEKAGAAEVAGVPLPDAVGRALDALGLELGLTPLTEVATTFEVAS